MAVPQVREAQVDLLLRDGDLRIEGSYGWHEGANKSWLKIDIPVQNKLGASLRLAISANQEIDNRIRIAMLFNTKLRIRGLCVNGNHSNKHTNKQKWTLETHWHRWTDDCSDRFAYDSTETSGMTPQETLTRFCDEVGIDCLVTLAEMPSHQPEMLV